MEKVVIIKYGELSTKKDNKNLFLSILKNNIESKLKGINHHIKYDFGRMIVYSTEINLVIQKLKTVFGIHEINEAYLLELQDIDSLSNKVNELIKKIDFLTFKVITKRSNKKYPFDSMEISKRVGSYILNNNENKKVDVHNPEININIEIRNEEILVYFSKIKCLGGYPVGCAGKAALMLSGGIDSPVAGYLAIKRGLNLLCVYFESPPHTSEMAKDKVLSLVKQLSIYDSKIDLHVINFTKIQEEILKNIPHEYLVTIMRRMMYRISEIIALKNNAKAIINGESIGQVASQTLSSMMVINEVVSIPVIRPVACFDKLEIIDISKKIGTYDISILPYEDCCTIFVPTHPVINPSVDKAREYEQLIDFESLIKEAIENDQIIKINKKHNDLL